jgi:hypothetical protein
MTAAGTGYLSAAYLDALSEFGTPRLLTKSGGGVLERPIPGTSFTDVMGPYPLLSCRDWSALPADLEALGTGPVSLIAVADPLGDHRPEDLSAAFPDLLIPFKAHFVVELDQPFQTVAPHHQRNARRALISIEVVRVEPASAADTWIALYGNLIVRHRIRGIAAFSPDSLRRQLDVPGTVILAARMGGEICGMLVWYVQGEAAYYHLGAYSEAGYAARASFALFWRAIEHFAAAGLQRLNLGAGAGLSEQADDGLTRFKRGWATTTRTAYLCGRIFDPNAYRALSDGAAAGSSSFFPAYRAGEIA